VKRFIFLIAILYLIAGFIGCGSAPKYAENSEVPWKVFYSASYDTKVLPNIFFVEAFVEYTNSNLLVSHTNGENKKIYSRFNSAVMEELIKRLEPGKMYKVYIRKDQFMEGLGGWFLDNIDGLSPKEIDAELQAKRKADEAERQRISAEEKRQREEEDAKPRFSPEGKEYVKRTLIQAVGESKNQANRGKTLFFESSRIKVTNSGAAGQYLISEVSLNSNNDYVIMEFYGQVPAFPRDMFSGFTILLSG
jgi:hypothetical protein